MIAGQSLAIILCDELARLGSWSIMRRLAPSPPGWQTQDPAPLATDPLRAAVRLFGAERRLSERETQILASATTGLSMKESAAELGISTKTVEDYWSRIYAKTRCRSQLEVLARLLDHILQSDRPL